MRRGKNHCILNKQYTESEYAALVENIKKHMDDMPYVDARGRRFGYGEFFPPFLSPIAYNESVAQEFFPLTKESALLAGYAWRDEEEKMPDITLLPDQVPDSIDDVSDDILTAVLGCAHAGACADRCTRAFRITKRELAFYKKAGLPIPRLCPNCRHYQRFASRPSSVVMSKRSCQCAGKRSVNGAYTNTAPHAHGDHACAATFETVYPAESPAQIYCHECYTAEVV
jgi:hypothetical protein